MTRYRRRKNENRLSTGVCFATIAIVFLYAVGRRLPSAWGGKTQCRGFRLRTTRTNPIAVCPSKTLFSYDDVDVVTDSQSRATDLSRRDTASQSDILVFIVESLALQKFLDDMPATFGSLDAGGAVYFSNFHHRHGGTRANVMPLLFGEPIAYDKRIRPGNYTAKLKLNITALDESALWRVAKRHGYTTVYGSTSCNKLMGLHTLWTSDSYCIHDTLHRHSDFDHIFPYEAFMGDCTVSKEARTLEDILRCDSEGPYHHKFLDYYTKFRQINAEVPIFAVLHLLEPHGTFLNKAIDFHVSTFFDWVVNEQRTTLIFMGDHGDESGTALGLVFPQKHADAREKLRPVVDLMVMHENLYSLIWMILSRSHMSAVDTFTQEVELNDCDAYEDLDVCFCDTKRSKLPPMAFDETFVLKAKEHIRSRSLGYLCESTITDRVASVLGEQRKLSFEIYLKNGAIFKAIFRRVGTFQISQLTRYASQIDCTSPPDEPEFCICNKTLFELDNKNFQRALSV